MNLLDGLNYYKTDSGWWNFTLTIEGSAVVRIFYAELFSRPPEPSLG